MTQQPSAAAPSLALPSSSLPSHSAPPAEPLVVIAYDLRDGSNANVSLTPPSVVRLHPSALIIDLQQAVLASNANTLRGHDYTQLDVYHPGSTDWTDRSAAAKPRSTVASLLPQADGADDTFVVIARPLPSFGGARGQSSQSPQRTLSSRLRPQPLAPLLHLASLAMRFCSPCDFLFLSHSLPPLPPLLYVARWCLQ
jgi:hypothetical protein